MVTQEQDTKIPGNWPGTAGEYMAFSALVRAGKQPGVDFSYRSGTQGRRMESDIEIDFKFHNPPDLALQVQESLYNHHSGLETRGRDILSKAQLSGSGVNLIFLDHDKLVQDPDWLISEALQYRDHSWE
jgi:hypothetical protein